MSHYGSFLGSTAQKGFMGTVVLQAIVILTMLSISLGLVEANLTSSGDQRNLTLPTYFALFLLAQIFHLFLTWDALRLRNIIQVFGLLIFQMGLIIYGSIQIVETAADLQRYPGTSCESDYPYCSGPGSLWYAVRPFQIVIPIVAGLSWFLLIFFAYKVYEEFGWSIFRLVGADPRLKEMFRYYQILIVLLKFDFFAFLGLTIQLLILVLHNDTAQFGLTIAAIPFCLIFLTACGIASAREIKLLMIASLILLLASWAYFIYKFCSLFLPDTRAQYVSTRKTIGVFLVACFLLDFATFWMGLKCLLDFGKGLRPIKMKEPSIFNLTLNFFRNISDEKESSVQKGSGKTPAEERGSWVGGEPLQPRMSIE